MDSSNHHDLYVRSIFSGREESIEFFRVTLPKKILGILDIEKLEDTRETFISDQLKESRTDKLYKIPLKNGKEVYTYLLLSTQHHFTVASGIPVNNLNGAGEPKATLIRTYTLSY